LLQERDQITRSRDSFGKDRADKRHPYFQAYFEDWMLDGGEDCLMSVSQQHATTSLCLIEASQSHTEREFNYEKD